jgi:hypothetical protein
MTVRILAVTHLLLGRGWLARLPDLVAVSMDEANLTTASKT